MSWFAIGRKGGPIRMFTRNPAQAAAQLQAGEVIVPSADDEAETISQDGKSVLLSVPSLADQKAARWSEAKAYRAKVADSGCSTPAGRVQTDAASYQRIIGAMTAAQADASFSVEWTMADNSIVTHDAAAVVAMGLAVTAFFAACQDAAEAIRAQIDAANDVQAVAAIDIMVGYPS